MGTGCCRVRHVVTPTRVSPLPSLVVDTDTHSRNKSAAESRRIYPVFFEDVEVRAHSPNEARTQGIFKLLLEKGLKCKLFIRIFDYFSLKDLARASGVCRLWYQIAGTRELLNKFVNTSREPTVVNSPMNREAYVFATRSLQYRSHDASSQTEQHQQQQNLQNVFFQGEGHSVNSFHNNNLDSPDPSCSFLVEEDQIPNNHPIKRYSGAQSLFREESNTIRINFRSQTPKPEQELPEVEESCFDIITDRECMVAIRNHFAKNNKSQRAQLLNLLDRLSSERGSGWNKQVWKFRTPRFVQSDATSQSDHSKGRRQNESRLSIPGSGGVRSTSSNFNRNGFSYKPPLSFVSEELTGRRNSRGGRGESVVQEGVRYHRKGKSQSEVTHILRGTSKRYSMEL